MTVRAVGAAMADSCGLPRTSIGIRSEREIEFLHLNGGSLEGDHRVGRTQATTRGFQIGARNRNGSKLHRTQRQRGAGRFRRGNATIELAVTLPLMALIVFGSVEVCSQIYTKQAIESAAYECARLATSNGATDAQVQARVTDILAARGINDAALVTTPVSINNVKRGDQITVTISAPAASNTMALTSFVSQGTIEAACVMVKEL